MGFGKDLKDTFQYLVQKNKSRFFEIELVTKLQDSLLFLAQKYPDLYSSEIIHGNRSMVKFDPQERWVTKIPVPCKKELADIMFVVYSVRKRLIRICVMQNKLTKGSDTDRFDADLLQLDLLHNRSEFYFEEEKNTIMSDSKEISVALYGVFHNAGLIYDMDMYAAPKVFPLSDIGITPRRKVEFIKSRGPYPSPTEYGDEFMLIGLEAFGDALVKCKIGRIIEIDDIDNIDILRGLSSLLLCPEELKGFLDTCIGELERMNVLHRKSNGNLKLDICNQLFFIDIDKLNECHQKTAQDNCNKAANTQQPSNKAAGRD